MKTLEQIIQSTPVFINNWSSEEDVWRDYTKNVWNTETDEYEAKPIGNEGYKVLFASYGTDNYSGDAWTLLVKDGELYETRGGHCSCYGLEGQFSPEKVVLKELENRVVNGDFGLDDWSGNTFKNELKQFLGLQP
jgi:hypothetical protein